MNDRSFLRPGIVASDVFTCLGEGMTAHRRAFTEGRVGVRFDAARGGVLGRIDELPRLPAELRRFESRAASIAYRLASNLEPSLRASNVARERVAVVIGTSTGGLDRTEAFLAGACDEPAYDRATQHAIAALPELVGEILDARGPRIAVSTACTSGAKAFGLARRLLRLGLADVAIVGAVDGLCATTVRGFQSLGVLSEIGCTPFAVTASGMNVAEGGALFVVTSDERGDVVLSGYGESTDAHHLAAPDPTGLGAEVAIRAALADAGRTAVDYVNAHGTGTKHNDEAEALALARTLGAGPIVSSTKGATGHLLGAASAVEAAFAIDAIRSGIVPPSIGAGRDVHESGIRLARACVRMDVRSAMSTSLAFGGSNAALVFERRGAA